MLFAADKIYHSRSMSLCRLGFEFENIVAKHFSETKVKVPQVFPFLEKAQHGI
jgi:hypothetical protein